MRPAADQHTAIIMAGSSVCHFRAGFDFDSCVGYAPEAGRQSYVRRRWDEAQVHFNSERVGNPAEPRDGGVSDRKGPMEHENKRQVDAQSDSGGGESIAANHPAPVADRIAPPNELDSEPGRYNPSRAEREKSCGSDPTGLRMRRDPE